jgi:hypothetical protein
MPEPLDLADVEARIERHRCRANIQRSSDPDVADLSRLIDQDAPALAAEVKRLRARWASSQRGVGELLDRSENAEFRLEKTAADLAAVNMALDRMVGAAEGVLAEAEQAETDAVFAGTPEPKRGPRLKALREALNALPAVQDEAVKP